MTFDDEIEYEGAVYDLDIQTSYFDAKPIPERIKISIVVSLIVAGDMYPVDTLALIYVLNTRNYICTLEHEEVDKVMYKMIIQKLDETYGSKWGKNYN